MTHILAQEFALLVQAGVSCFQEVDLVVEEQPWRKPGHGVPIYTRDAAVLFFPLPDNRPISPREVAKYLNRFVPAVLKGNMFLSMDSYGLSALIRMNMLHRSAC